MKYVSIDIETTGLDENIHQIIEIAAIIEDTNKPTTYEEAPKFRRFVLNPDGKYLFSSYAANLNKRIIEVISKIENGGKYEQSETPNLDDGYCYEDNVVFQLTDFLNRNEIFTYRSTKINVAGKNFKGFDQKFLYKLPDFKNRIEFDYRGLDPASIFIDWDIDASAPSTEKCKVRAGSEGKVSHEALQDAWDIIELFRFDKNQKDEFKRLKRFYDDETKLIMFREQKKRL